MGVCLRLDDTDSLTYTFSILFINLVEPNTFLLAQVVGFSALSKIVVPGHYHFCELLYNSVVCIYFIFFFINFLQIQPFSDKVLSPPYISLDLSVLSHAGLLMINNSYHVSFTEFLKLHQTWNFIFKILRVTTRRSSH